MEILEISISKIDIENNSIEIIERNNYGDDFDNYLNGLVNIVVAGNGRKFEFERDTTEVRAQIKNIISNQDFSSVTKGISQRLLEREQAAQVKIARMNHEIQKGVVVQAKIKENDLERFIICKADHSDFIDETNFTLKKGLPIKKKIFKAFICTISAPNNVVDILVYDPNQSLYWWSEFLELKKIYSDEDNTENAFGVIDRQVFSKIKKDNPKTWLHLRNSTLTYFRSNETFDMDHYLENVIGNYEPDNENVNIPSLKEKIKDLSKKSKTPFDDQFTIVKSKITAKYSSNIKLTEQIELHLKEGIEKMDDIITAAKDTDGTKYVRINSDEGYKYFKERQQGNL